MKVMIKKVGISTFNPDTDEIFDFWILGRLQTMREIRIFDNLPYDLRDMENQEIDCLLFMTLSGIPVDHKTEDQLKTPILKGYYLGKYKLSDKWRIPKYIKLKYDHIKEFHAIQVENDIFLISPSDIEYYSVKKGEEFTFQAIEFELLTWNPIK
ncbi:MAG: hypothetical protein ACFFBV_07990 [Promethearchaeota archaeon]